MAKDLGERLPTPTAAPVAVRGGVLIAVLAVAGISVSLMQTLVIPLLPQLPTLLDTSTANASWAITATLLTGAVATPVFGRLGDMYGAKRILIACAVLLTVGSVVAALTSSLIPFIIGRALQGFGAPVIPLGISVLRAALPEERVGGAMGLMSASLGVGGALGLPLSAVIAENLNWHALFWCAALLGVLSATLFALLVPSVPAVARGRFDPLGALGLAAGLILLLLPISKGASWGWTSPLTLGLLVASAVVLYAFARWQYRAPSPLVDMRTTLKPPILLTNVASVAIGFGMFAMTLVGPQLLQMPTSTGYGLGQNMIQAGLWMAPGGLAMMAAAPLAARVTRLRGPKFTLIVGSVIVAAGYLVGTQLLGSPAGVLTFSVIVSTGVGFAFAALPALINSAVPVSETAAANGINSLARSMGTSTSSAVMSAVLAQMTVMVAGHAFPSLGGFRTALIVAGCAAVVAAIIASRIPVAPAVAAEATADRADELAGAFVALERNAAVGPDPEGRDVRSLSRPDFLFLSYVDDAGAITLAELAGRLAGDPTRVGQRLTAMVRGGLVRPAGRPEYEGTQRFSLTAHGYRKLSAQRRYEVEGLRHTLADWDEGDVAALIGYLERLADSADVERQRRSSAARSVRPPQRQPAPRTVTRSNQVRPPTSTRGRWSGPDSRAAIAERR